MYLHDLSDIQNREIIVFHRTCFLFDEEISSNVILHLNQITVDRNFKKIVRFGFCKVLNSFNVV